MRCATTGSYFSHNITFTFRQMALVIDELCTSYCCCIKSKRILGRELPGGSVTRVLHELGYASAPELRLLIVDGRCTQYPLALAPLFSINALPDRVTPRWPPPSLLLSRGSDIKESPFTVVSRTARGQPVTLDRPTVIRLSETVEDRQTDGQTGCSSTFSSIVAVQTSTKQNVDVPVWRE